MTMNNRTGGRGKSTRPKACLCVVSVVPGAYALECFHFQPMAAVFSPNDTDNASISANTKTQENRDAK